MANTLVSSTTIAAPTGSARAGRLIYAVNSARWWFFYLSAASTLATLYSSDGVTWTAGGTKALGQSIDGWNFGVYYANIASTDVIHIAVSAANSSNSAQHYRATISGTSITFGSVDTIGTSFYQFEDAAVFISSDGHVRQMVVQGGDWYGYAWPNADTGTGWTVGSPVSGPGAGNNSYKSAALAQTSATHMLAVLDDSAAAGTSETTAASYQLTYGTFNGTTWTDQGSITPTTAVSEKFNDWSISHLSDTDIHLVHRTGTNSYEHARYNGSTWSSGSTIPTQSSVDGGGLAMWNDGTTVYLAVIDSAAGNAVRFNSWTSAGGWGTWADIEATSATRSNLGVSQSADGSGNWLLYWTDGSASPWAIKGAAFSPGGGGTTWTASAALAGELDATALAAMTWAGASTLSGQANLTAAGVRTYVAQAVLSGQMNLTAAAGTLLVGAAALAAEGDLVGASTLTLGAAAILSGELDLVAQATATLAGQAALAAELDLTADGVISGGPASAQLSGQANLTVSASVQRFGQASLSGQMNLVSQAALQLAGAAVLSGALNLSADSLRTIGASASLSGELDMTVLAALHLAAAAAMQAEMDMSVLAALTVAGAAALSGELDLTAGASAGGYIQPLATILLDAALAITLAFDTGLSATIVLESVNDGSVE